MKLKNPFPKIEKYDSPITLVYNEIANKVSEQLDSATYKAIVNAGIDVDKEKLISALKSDSDRYRKAYNKGYEDAKKNLYDIHDVAELLTELFGDGCACNFNDIDEWLPYCCEYRETECPHPKSGNCWEQYLIHRYRKENEDV